MNTLEICADVYLYLYQFKCVVEKKEKKKKNPKCFRQCRECNIDNEGLSTIILQRWSARHFQSAITFTGLAHALQQSVTRLHFSARRHVALRLWNWQWEEAKSDWMTAGRSARSGHTLQVKYTSWGPNNLCKAASRVTARRSGNPWLIGSMSNRDWEGWSNLRPPLWLGRTSAFKPRKCMNNS